MTSSTQKTGLFQAHSIHLKLLIGGLVLFVAGIMQNNYVWASEASSDTNHRVHFEIQQKTQVDNDELIIRFNSVAKGGSAQEVTRDINRTMQSAMRVLQKYPQIISKTEHYSVYPVYVKQTIKNWRGKQVLSLAMKNDPDLLKAVERIQDILNYQSMHFSVSEQRREQVLKKLQSQAIAKFRQQAQSIADDFGAQSFQITNTQIRQNQPLIQPRAVMAQADVASFATRSAPVIESGQSEITISLNGSMILHY